MTYVTTGYVLQTPISEADWQALRARVDAAIAPAPLSALLEALGRLWAVTARRPDQDSVETGAALQTICEALRDYPGEAALEAVREWPRTAQGKWRPTLAELLEEAETRARDIERMSRAIGREYPAGQDQPERDEYWRVPASAETRPSEGGPRISKAELAELMRSVGEALKAPPEERQREDQAREAAKHRFVATQARPEQYRALAEQMRQRAAVESHDGKRSAMLLAAETYELRAEEIEQ